MTLPFDPAFDDCRWTDAWLRLPLLQVVPGQYETFTITRWQMSEADICGQVLRLSPPLDVRGLVMADGALWMSDVPQERLMMFNNAQISRGLVLVGGLGLGLYPQYALPLSGGMVIIERDAALCRVVGPLVEVAAAAAGVPVTIRQGDLGDFLRAEPSARYDTIFLDTWDTLDAAHLPYINTLRERAIRHLAPGGRVLLWGYGWMLRLFEGACERLLRVESGQRENWLQVMARQHPAVWRLLLPVLEHFSGQPAVDTGAALAWCRDYAVSVTG